MDAISTNENQPAILGTLPASPLSLIGGKLFEDPAVILLPSLKLYASTISLMLIAVAARWRLTVAFGE